MCSFSTLTLMVGWQEGHPACKKYGVIRCWRGYLSGARCKCLHMVQLMPLPPHHLLLQQNPEWFILLVLAYPGCPGKKVIKRLCVCVVSYSCTQAMGSCTGTGDTDRRRRWPQVVCMLTHGYIANE